MGTRFIIGELVTGRRIVTLPVLSGTWSEDLDVPETVSVIVKLNNDVARTLDLRNAATATKTFLAAVDTGPFGEDNRILAAGPLWSVSYDRAKQTLELTARGIQSIFDHRYVLPPSALNFDVMAWTVPDPTDPSGIGTIPNPALATTFSNLALGGIMVSLVTQALSWSGGNLPIVLPAVETGTNTRTYQGTDFKTVGSALTDLINVEGGPELNFYPEFDPADPTAVRWIMQVGTSAEPLIYAPTVQAWNVTVKDSPVKSLNIDLDGSGMGSISWATGGRQADKLLVSRAIDMRLVNSGYPLLETLDSTHSDVVVQATLDGYATSNLRLSATPVETWSFTVKAHPIDSMDNSAGPQLGDYNVGDFLSLHIDPYNDETNRGDLYIPGGGDFGLRIVGLSGNEKGEDVLIKCAPVVS